jgi:hypothetical protein
MAVFGRKTVDGVIAQLTKMQKQLGEVYTAQMTEADGALERAAVATSEAKAAEAEARRAAAISSNIGALIGS